ncbi:NosD domain-containing protein [uncultured Methanolobus sp.]|uniref:NosD domain-containing protein n=1 Tax=uncultured Methanolobus sp. TaxID=218300 RepID=UPI002AAAC343|nr:NosD domain-containing protein [uncultured Methanolobus sp.]
MRLSNILIFVVILYMCSTQITIGSNNSLSDVRNYVYTEPCYPDLTGDNIVIGIWEVGENQTTERHHKVNATLSEFQNRVTVMEDYDNVSSHATSVALIIGSNPGDATERGMAPDIEMWSYNSGNDYNEIKTASVDLTSHSYGKNSSLGGYLDYALEFDKAIRENNTISFKSAGNKFYVKENSTGSGYGSISRPGTAKNIITVGATNNSQFDEVAYFSSSGPTDDGRLKPEIVAPGYKIDLEPNPYPDQKPISGTSLACPVVSGSAALVLEQWQKNHQEDMLPSTMKALLVHTANNDGNGPTFRSGYGMLDTREAVELVILDETEDTAIIQDFSTFATGDNSTEMILTVPAHTAELKVTLAWSDKEGILPTTLWNDLDLVIYGPGGDIYEPWILDPANPEDPATTGSDDLNPLEMVQIVDPDAGTYRINISGSIDEPSQSFSLVTSVKSNVYDGADIVLVIDSSVSMNWSDHYDLRKDAAKLFVDIVDDNDQMAVVDFDFDAIIRESLCNVGDNRGSLKDAIDEIDSDGTTNIDHGLEAGYSELNGANAIFSHSKGAILFSDGGGLYPSSAVSSYVSKGWPIYTIAYGGSSSSKSIMKNIAQATGGVYYDSQEDFGLLEIYTGIIIDKLKLIESAIYQIHSEKHTISAGESIEGAIATDSTINFFEVALFYWYYGESSTSSAGIPARFSENESENSLEYVEDTAWEDENSTFVTLSQEYIPLNNISLVLYYPNGTEVPLNASSSTGTDDPEIIYNYTYGYEIYKINKQLPGNWTYNITSTQDSIWEYALVVNANTSITFDPILDKTEYSTGERVHINVNLFSETQGISDANVTAYMTLPDQTTCNISLIDMGNGSYVQDLGYAMQEGTYEIMVEVVKGDVVRQKCLGFEAIDPSWVNFVADVRFGMAPCTVNFTDLSANATEWEWDVDGDGVVDYVTQNVSHTYNSTGTYTVSLTVGNGTDYGTETKLSYIGISLIVDDSGGADYTTIQAAVNAAIDGQTILVYPGTYNENVNVNKQLNITSTGGAAVTYVIAANANDDVFDVTADGVTISGFNVSGATGDYRGGISLAPSSNYNTLISNIASNNNKGIFLSNSDNNLLTNNTALNNNDGIYLLGAENNVLTNNIASNNNDGIYLLGAENSVLTNNIASNNNRGIFLSNSDNNLLTNNTASNNNAGIFLLGAENNVLTNNTASNNGVEGIILKGSSNNNTFTGNIASNNEFGGICLVTSSNNMLTGNTVANNGDDGIFLRDSSNNLVYNNFFNNTENAIFYGTCTGNVWNITKTTGLNIVGGPYRGGNYWATPNGTGFSQTCNDADGDRICDSDYALGGENIDYLPLAEHEPGNGNIITVDDSSGADYTTIQAAVNAAIPGNTILVYPGIYIENVDVGKPLDIKSTGGAAVTSVTAAYSNDSVFEITADGVAIDGFSVNGAGGDKSGIYLNSSGNITLANNIVSNNGLYGIFLIDSSNNLIYNNFFNNTENAFFYGACTGNVWNITKTTGLNIVGGPYRGGNYWATPNGTGFSQTCNDVDGDRICDSGYALGGENIDYLPLAEVNVISVDDSGGEDYTTIQAAVTAASQGDTILVYPGTYSENVDVDKQLNIVSTGGGAVTSVTAASSDDHVFEVTVDGVMINGFSMSSSATGNSYYAGICLESSNNSTLVNNIASNSNCGILLKSSCNCMLENNTASNNKNNYTGWSGIHLHSSDNNTLVNNKASNNAAYGILLKSSCNNTLVNNIALSNPQHGILLYNNSNSNTLAGNIVLNNENAGIFLGNSGNNLIYNNFFNNTENALFYGTCTGNVWNITRTAGMNIVGGPYLGGNYWAKPDGTGFSQTCNDTDGDGICDSSYVISGDHIDYLPLAEVNVISVDDSGGAAYTTIQAAVNAASPGHTILVYPGTYIENVNVDKQLNITSTDGAAVTSVAAADSNDHVFEITADGVTIDGFSVSGVGDDKPGIYLTSSGSTLANNIVSNNDMGISLEYSNNSMLVNNTVSDGVWFGICLYLSNNNTVIDNTVSTHAMGILMTSSVNNTLEYNKVSNNGWYGIFLIDSNNDRIYNNFFNNTVNTYFSGTCTGNIWNTTKTAGVNIFGGPYLGGNYWATPSGTGFSQIGNDTNGDGICESIHALNGDNVDFLPLGGLQDWNPWNDFDSAGSPDGRYITIDEYNEAYTCHVNNTPAPKTGATIDIGRVIALYTAYYNNEPM